MGGVVMFPKKKDELKAFNKEYNLTKKEIDAAHSRIQKEKKLFTKKKNAIEEKNNFWR